MRLRRRIAVAVDDRAHISKLMREGGLKLRAYGVSTEEIEDKYDASMDATAELQGFLDGGGDPLSDDGMQLHEEWNRTANEFVSAVEDEARRRGIIE